MKQFENGTLISQRWDGLLSLLRARGVVFSERSKV